MGYIQQDSPLVTGTIWENIAYGLDKEPSQAGVEEAAALANRFNHLRLAHAAHAHFLYCSKRAAANAFAAIHTADHVNLRYGRIAGQHFL